MRSLRSATAGPAIAAITFSALRIILSSFTLVVLDKTLGVYRGQAKITETQSIIMAQQRKATQGS
jgi:hypothetical protein